jgi:DNA-binding transcriptional ArsR family regulator
MSDETTQTTQKVNKALVRAAGHQVGFAIIRILAERGSASGKELAAALSKPRSTVSEQLRRLEVEGLIECVAEESRRGTVERFYRATPLARWVEDDEMGQLRSAEKRRLALRAIQSVVADASSALSTNTLDRRDDWCLASLRVTVDEQGWKELAEIHRQALEAVVKVRDESAERLAQNGEPLRALASLILLELPPAR